MGRAYNWSKEHLGGWEHILIATKVLGRKLPTGVQIHHVDGDGTNNSHSNLVLCDNRRYHALLHRRADALKNCGYASFLKCCYCGIYGPPSTMLTTSNGTSKHITANLCPTRLHSRR